MWRPLLILCVCISNSQSSGDGANNNSSSPTYCVLPPQPLNGRYDILEPELPNLVPGTKLQNFTIQVSCNPGYHLTEHPVTLCLDGWKSQELTECLPYCSKPRDDVISCGAVDQGQQSRCILPDQVLASLSTRSNPNETKMECGSTGPEYAEVIAGGRAAIKQELPWHAGVYTKRTQPYMQICGGSLVSQTVVISAAHCFWTDVEKQLPASDYAVAVGKRYRPWNDPNDVKAQKSDVAGWGLTSEDGRESPVLQVVEMPFVGIEDCIERSDLSFRSHITSDKICAGYRNGTSVCRGDSGGGLAFPEAIEGIRRYFLRGIVSAAPRNNHLCNTLAWGTFTHVQKHEAFIRDKVPETSSLSATFGQQSPGQQIILPIEELL